MKACFVFAIVLVVAFAAFAQSEEVASNEQVTSISDEQVHMLEKRQIRLPGCQLWECNSNCIRRGFKGGYCAFTGCSCY